VIEHIVVAGSPAAEVLAEARRSNADLIVVAPRRRDSTRR
jgi:nucleotide-binding universal stress UspA family protein